MIQNRSEVPKNRASRSAVSALIRRWPCTISLIRRAWGLRTGCKDQVHAVLAKLGDRGGLLGPVRRLEQCLDR